MAAARWTKSISAVAWPCRFRPDLEAAGDDQAVRVNEHELSHVEEFRVLQRMAEDDVLHRVALERCCCCKDGGFKFVVTSPAGTVHEGSNEVAMRALAHALVGRVVCT